MRKSFQVLSLAVFSLLATPVAWSAPGDLPAVSSPVAQPAALSTTASDVEKAKLALRQKKDALKQQNKEQREGLKKKQKAERDALKEKQKAEREKMKLEQAERRLKIQ